MEITDFKSQKKKGVMKKLFLSLLCSIFNILKCPSLDFIFIFVEEKKKRVNNYLDVGDVKFFPGFRRFDFYNLFQITNLK